MRNIPLRFVCVLLCVAASGRAASADFRTDSLATLCTVWAEVKFQNPRLLLREVDWDGALVRAIPKVREAQTSDQVAQAIGAMLAELGDPVTRVSRQNGPRPAAPIPLLRWEGDVLIVDIGPYRDSVTDEAFLLVAPLGAQVTAELPKAKAVVFDFRTKRPATPGTILPDLGLLLDNLALTREAVAVPPRRRVFHSGYVPGPWPGTFYSAVQVLPSPPSWGSGEQGGLPARYVFIAGEELPDQAAALWWSGHAAIVAEAPGLDDRIARTRTIDLGGGWSAAVRVSETIAQGISADAVAEPGSTDDAAMTKALALARDPAPLPARPAPRLTATVPIATTDATYADMKYPDLPYRLLALFRLWSIVDRFYPFDDRLGDWRAALAEFIPRFEGASNGEEYAGAILELLARLEDGHAAAWGGPTWGILGARLLPLELRSIEGRFIVIGKAEELPPDSPIAIGDEIVSIDGEPLEERVRRLWKYYGASNEAARTAKVLYWAIRGPWDSVAELVVRGADGVSRTVRVARTRSLNIVREGEIWRLLDGNIGYVDLTRLTIDQVDAMFDALSGADAIVLDMRGYPNGTSWAIAPRINTKHAAVGAIYQRPQLAPSEETETQTTYSFAQALPKTDRTVYTGPTVMLIDERTYSQAEGSGLLFEAANGTKFIGSNSAGAVGDKIYFNLPGGIEVNFTGLDARHVDGRPVQGIGLVPDVRVEPTVAGIRAGRDEVLERAVAYLRQTLAEGGR